MSILDIFSRGIEVGTSRAPGSRQHGTSVNGEQEQEQDPRGIFVEEEEDSDDMVSTFLQRR